MGHEWRRNEIFSKFLNLSSDSAFETQKLRKGVKFRRVDKIESQ